MLEQKEGRQEFITSKTTAPQPQNLRDIKSSVLIKYELRYVI